MRAVDLLLQKISVTKGSYSHCFTDTQYSSRTVDTLQGAEVMKLNDKKQNSENLQEKMKASFLNP